MTGVMNVVLCFGAVLAFLSIIMSIFVVRNKDENNNHWLISGMLIAVELLILGMFLVGGLVFHCEALDDEEYNIVEIHRLNKKIDKLKQKKEEISQKTFSHDKVD